MPRLSFITALLLIPVAPVRLHPLIVTYTPPGYIGGAPDEYEDPESLKGLEGGTVKIAGRGDLQTVAATLGNDTLVVQPDISGWSISLPMPAKRAVVFVSDGMED